MPFGIFIWCPRSVMGGVHLREVVNIAIQQTCGWELEHGVFLQEVSAYRKCPLTGSVRTERFCCTFDWDRNLSMKHFTVCWSGVDLETKEDL